MASKMEVLELSRLDQTVLRVYVRQLLIFPFAEATSTMRREAQTVLTAGLLATLRQFPFLAGTVEILDSETGALTVRYPKSIDVDLVSRMLTVNDSDLDSLEYQSLIEAGVPPSALPADVLCPFALRSHPGIDDPYAEILTTFAKRKPIPVFAVQINFVSGGLVLSAYTHHSVVDGTGIAKIYETWSKCTRDYSDSERIPAQIKAADLNKARNALDSLAEGAISMKLPEFRYPGDRVDPPLRNSPYNLSAKLLVFSAATICQLANSLSHSTNVRISNFTALCSLVWCQVTNARREAMLEKGVKDTTLGIAVDHRKHVGSLLPDDYLGNCANGMIVPIALASMPTAENMNAENIAPVALALSSGLGDVDLEWFKTRLLELSKRDISSEWMLNLETRNGPDIFITSWQHIGADTIWAIPGTSKTGDGERWRCKPTAIRKPHNMWEGGMQILPRQRGDQAPFEIPLCLEEGEMERTLHGLKAGNWVERVIDA
ncbi:transferase family-domain-containing protein [Boeremia exigua]|uniref:transferase family-domain-containing protein n=1 Tax=Boeremia exigua TaxID=749465 RepID=UPI001E8EC244|nr:transferase family-domain-containing protein [Boeremia exigua]KAH6629250.1 transferase family-domain-containing protein [Boeremia exigua]